MSVKIEIDLSAIHDEIDLHEIRLFLSKQAQIRYNIRENNRGWKPGSQAQVAFKKAKQDLLCISEALDKLNC